MTTLVQCASIPRSGHHYLEKLLRRYFNPKGSKTKRMAYCEYYGCCKTRPCRLYKPDLETSVAKVHLLKSHDEFLRTNDEQYEPPLDPTNEVKHLVQIRHPIPGTISEFLMVNSNLTKRRNSYDGEAVEDRPLKSPLPASSKDDWLSFAAMQLEYRKQFLEKWILRNPWFDSQQYYFLDYDSFLASASEKLREVILFLCPEESIDNSLIESIFAERPVKPKRNPLDFEYASTLDELDRLYAETWQACREKLSLKGKLPPGHYERRTGLPV